MGTNDLYVQCLDHGYVRLVDSMGSDLSIVRAARVSYDADWRTGEDEGKDKKLIDYMLKNHHTSPFESVTFTFEIKCPIFIARQWHRHRTWAYNEVSARYTELPEEFYVPQPEHIGAQSNENKQARVMSVEGIDLHAEEMAGVISMQCRMAFETYHKLLSEGVPRELARSVLPVATYTRFFGTVNLHNLMHFIGLRLHKHAQWEIQQYAKALAHFVGEVCPTVYELVGYEEKIKELDNA